MDESMSYVAFTRMMDSGVLRPGDREIRRGPGGIPLYGTRQVSDLLNHSLDVLFGSELQPNQQKMPRVVSLSRAEKPTPSQAAFSQSSLKAMLIWLGLLDQPNDGSSPESPSPQILVPRLKARIQKLESLLKAERALCQAQGEELSKLRAQANRNDVLEEDLAIERESAAQLVHWLQEAEQELADLRRGFCGAGK
jgi:hypothetical protein